MENYAGTAFDSQMHCKACVISDSFQIEVLIDEKPQMRKAEFEFVVSCIVQILFGIVCEQNKISCYSKLNTLQRIRMR